MKQISMREGAVKEAAMWIKLNNRYLKEDPLENIEACIQEHVDKAINYALTVDETYYISSAGWTVLYLPDGDGYGEIQILVDPLVSKGNDYMTVYKEEV